MGPSCTTIFVPRCGDVTDRVAKKLGGGGGGGGAGGLEPLHFESWGARGGTHKIVSL